MSKTSNLSTQAAVGAALKQERDLRSLCRVDSRGNHYASASVLIKGVGWFLLVTALLCAVYFLGFGMEFLQELAAWGPAAIIAACAMMALCGAYLVRIKYTLEETELVCQGLWSRRIPYVELQEGAQARAPRIRRDNRVTLRTSRGRPCRINIVWTRGGYHLLYLLEQKTGIAMFEQATGQSREYYDLSVDEDEERYWN